MAEESLIAVFVDFENLAIGVRDAHHARGEEFQIQLVLKRLLEKGRLVYKRAYCDWSNYPSALREFHTHGIEMVDIPQSRASGKNSADIRMVVDAIDLCYSKEHIDTFALVSGDSDFSPLVSKLKENDKRVIGCGVKSSSSGLLIANCDEFIYYDDLIREAQKSTVRDAQKASQRAQPGAKKGVKKEHDKRQEAVDRLVKIIRSLEIDYTPLWGSIVKQALRRVHPDFNESYYGYRGFSDLLEDAQSRGLIDLEHDEARGNYKVRLKESAEEA